MVVLEAGDGLRVQVPVQNTGAGTGLFKVSGQVLYKNGTPVWTLAEQGTGNVVAQKEIPSGTIGSFVFEKSGWGGGNPLAFDQDQLFDVRFICQVDGVEGQVTATDLSAIKHDRGYATPPKPANPTMLSTIAESSTSAYIKIGWTGVTCVPAVVSYEVWCNGVRKAILGPTVREYTITGLVPGSNNSVWVKACNEIGCTASDSVGMTAAHWVPPIGDAVPKLNMLIMNVNDGQQKTLYPGMQYVTIKANQVMTPEMRIQNIGEGDGEFKVTLEMFYAGTNTRAATFVDLTRPNQTYPFPQGMEVPIIFSGKETTNDPYGFAEGQMFDLICTLSAVVGTGYEQRRIANCLRWSRGLTAPPPPGNVRLISTTAQSSTSATITIGWDLVTANPAVTAYEVWRDGIKRATVGASTNRHTTTGLVPGGSYSFWVKAVNSIGTTSSPAVGMTAAHWVDPGGGDPVPQLNLAILTTTKLNQQKIVFPPSLAGQVTIKPDDTIYCEIRIQNVGETSGYFRFWFGLVYAGTNTVAATFIDTPSLESGGAPGWHLYNFPQGLEVPIVSDSKKITSDPYGFNEGQLFDLLVKIEAVVGTGAQNTRASNVAKWQR